MRKARSERADGEHYSFYNKEGEMRKSSRWIKNATTNNKPENIEIGYSRGVGRKDGRAMGGRDICLSRPVYSFDFGHTIFYIYKQLQLNQKNVIHLWNGGLRTMAKVPI